MLETLLAPLKISMLSPMLLSLKLVRLAQIAQLLLSPPLLLALVLVAESYSYYSATAATSTAVINKTAVADVGCH